MEQVPKTRPKAHFNEAWGDVPIIGRGTFYVRRLIGTVPVAEDGSAHLKAPAIRDISLNALDAEGRAIQMKKTTFHVMPGERASCVGCHEHDRTPPAGPRMPLAAGTPAAEPQRPNWGTGGIIDYVRVVQPVFDRHCVECHSGPRPKGAVDLSGDVTRYFNMSYNMLIDQGLVYHANLAGEAPTKTTPKAFGSMVSKIPRIHRDRSQRRRAAPGGPAAHLRIDADVPFYGTYAHTSNNRKLAGFRDRWHVGTETDWFRKKVMPVFERRCVECHQRQVDTTQPYATGTIAARVTSRLWPDAAYMSYFFGARDTMAAFAGPAHRVNLTNPDFSQMLTAPLAKDAGGLGLCATESGGPVFQDTNDADYQALRDGLREGARILKEHPIDMPPPPMVLDE